MLYLTEHDVDELLDMPTTVEVVQEAFRQLAHGAAHNVPRVRAKGKGVVLHSMSAAADYLGLVGWKQYTTTPSGARFQVGLHDSQSGEMVALIQADRLGQMRTGAVTGVAVRHLTVADTKEVGLIGAGWQAESQLAAVAAVRPITRALVYCRDEKRRRRFAKQAQQRLAIETLPVDQPDQAVRNLPIVITATTSQSPVLHGQWTAPGSLVCAIGSNWLHKTEIDVETVRRAKAVVCDSIAACRAEAGDLAAAHQQGDWNWSDAVELADVVAGNISSRSSPDDLLVFKSVGLAIEDVAVGAKLVELARAQGKGRTVDI